MSKEKLAIIIPTKNRPDKLTCLLKSIHTQEVLPVQTIVVDGGDTGSEDILRNFPNYHIDYVKAPCSLTVQRNIGIKRLKRETTLVSFFDDDAVLETDALKNMMKFWEFASPDTGGASFNNISDAYKPPTFLERIFFVNTNTPGRILMSGFQSKICSLNKTTQTEWLLGCATVWRRHIFDGFLFDEWYSGYARYEDVDFSYRVGRSYRLFVVHNAKVKHFNKTEDITFSSALGKMQVINRLHFVRKNPNLSVFLCYWACFGLFLNNVLKGFLGRNIRYINRAKGNITAFIEILSKRTFT